MYRKTRLGGPLFSPKRILPRAIITGLCTAILFSACFSFFLHTQREQANTELSIRLNDYLKQFLDSLYASTRKVSPLLDQTCIDASRQLTEAAAFTINVRTFILVKQGIAYCSSATGEMNLPLHQITPHLDLKKSVDLALMPGTPMMPDKPTIGVWFSEPNRPDAGVFIAVHINLAPYLLFSAQQNNITAVALVSDQSALVSTHDSLISRAELPPSPDQISQIGQYPLTLYIYSPTWQLRDIQFSILIGLIFGIMCALVAAYIMQSREKPGKEILIGIKKGQFFVVYQPVINASTLQPEGVEALIRWQHPTAGIIPPDVFIPLAETQGIIIPLTHHLFRLLEKDAPQLQETLTPGSRLSINLAPSHLYSPEFRQDILVLSSALAFRDTPLVFEITERDMLKQEEACEIFDWLHERGFNISVDDFGTGHSALIYLERFKLDYLKIDRGFVTAIGVDTVTAPVLDAVVSLAHRLEMQTVAEGVETPEQARWLIDRGVNYLQGYFFSKPLPLNELTIWYANPIWQSSL